MLDNNSLVVSPRGFVHGFFQSTYISPFENYRKQGYQGNLVNDYKVIGSPNGITGHSRPKIDIMIGVQDVDYWYKEYQKNGSLFKGSSEVAMENREAIIKLTKRLMKDSWLMDLKREYIHRTRELTTSIYSLNMLKDILIDIGLDNSREKPKFPLSYHLTSITDFLSDTRHSAAPNASGFVNGLNQDKDRNATFDKLFPYASESDFVNRFIIGCISKGEVGLLITYLFALFGSVALQDID